MLDNSQKHRWQCGGLKAIFPERVVSQLERYKTVSPRKSIRQSHPRSVPRSKKALLNALMREVIHEPQPTAEGTLKKVLEVLGE